MLPFSSMIFCIKPIANYVDCLETIATAYSSQERQGSVMICDCTPYMQTTAISQLHNLQHQDSLKSVGVMLLKCCVQFGKRRG